MGLASHSLIADCAALSPGQLHRHLESLRPGVHIVEYQSIMFGSLRSKALDDELRLMFQCCDRLAGSESIDEWLKDVYQHWNCMDFAYREFAGLSGGQRKLCFVIPQIEAAVGVRACVLVNVESQLDSLNIERICSRLDILDVERVAWVEEDMARLRVKVSRPVFDTSLQEWVGVKHS